MRAFESVRVTNVAVVAEDTPGIVRNLDRLVASLERAVEVGDLGAIINGVRHLRLLVWDLEDDR